MNVYKIALAQMKVEYSEPQKNLERAALLAEQAAEQGCRCVVFPECCDIGWANPDAPKLAAPIPGPVSDFFCRLAQKHRMVIVAGVTERAGDKLYNSAVIADADGTLAGIHRKINLLDDVENMYTRGDRLQLYHTAAGKIGVTICADNAPHSLQLSSSLACMGADWILSPCSWAVVPEESKHNPTYAQQWIDPYTTLSRYYHVDVLGVSNVGDVTKGAWSGWKCIGSSVVVRSSGSQVDVLPYGPEAQTLKVFECEVKQEENRFKIDRPAKSGKEDAEE